MRHCFDHIALLTQGSIQSITNKMAYGQNKMQKNKLPLEAHYYVSLVCLTSCTPTAHHFWMWESSFKPRLSLGQHQGSISTVLEQLLEEPQKRMVTLEIKQNLRWSPNPIQHLKYMTSICRALISQQFRKMEKVKEEENGPQVQYKGYPPNSGNPQQKQRYEFLWSICLAPIFNVTTKGNNSSWKVE